MTEDKVLIHSEDIYHWGIHGQQWGKRRYQNEDGSLTPLGRIHYGVGEAKERSKIKIREMKAETKSAVKLAKAQAKAAKAVADAEKEKIAAKTKEYRDRKEADNIVELERIKAQREADRMDAKNEAQLNKNLAEATKENAEVENKSSAVKAVLGIMAAAGVGYLIYKAVSNGSSSSNKEAATKAISKVSDKPASEVTTKASNTIAEAAKSEKGKKWLNDNDVYERLTKDGVLSPKTAKEFVSKVFTDGTTRVHRNDLEQTIRKMISSGFAFKHSDNNDLILVHSAKGPDIYHYGVKGQKWGVITKKEDEQTSGRIKNTYGYTEGTSRRDQDEGGIGGGSQTPGVNGSGYYHPSASNTDKKYNVEKVQENYAEAVTGLGLGAAKAVLEGKMSYKDASDRIWQTMVDLDNRRKNEPGFEYQLQLGDGTQLFANSQTNNMSKFFQDALYILRIVCDEADKGPAYKKAYLDAINNGDFFKSVPSSGKFNKDTIKFAISDIKRQINSMPKAQSKLATASKQSLNDSKKKTLLSTINQNNKDSSKNKSKASSTKVENATVNKPKHMGGIASISKKSTKTDKTPKFNGSGVKTYYHNDKKRYSHNLKQSDNNGLILVHSADGPDVQHWGIKGQKWGVRRWQYEDGSLTPEGRIHYGRISEKGQQEGRLTGRTAKFNTREFNTLNRRMARNASKYEKTGKRKYAERALENAELLSNEKFVKNEARIMNDQSSAHFVLGIPGQILMAAANSSLLKEDQNIWNETKTKFQNMSLDELDKAFKDTIGKTEKVKFNAKEMDKETKAKEDAIFKDSKEYREIGGQYKNEKEARKAYETHMKIADENFKKYQENEAKKSSKGWTKEQQEEFLDKRYGKKESQDTNINNIKDLPNKFKNAKTEEAREELLTSYTRNLIDGNKNVKDASEKAFNQVFQIKGQEFKSSKPKQYAEELAEWKQNYTPADIKRMGFNSYEEALYDEIGRRSYSM